MLFIIIIIFTHKLSHSWSLKVTLLWGWLNFLIPIERSPVQLLVMIDFFLNFFSLIIILYPPVEIQWFVKAL